MDSMPSQQHSHCELITFISAQTGGSTLFCKKISAFAYLRRVYMQKFTAAAPSVHTVSPLEGVPSY